MWLQVQTGSNIQVPVTGTLGVQVENVPLTVNIIRSEERRVGKACRYRCDWSSDVCSSDLYLNVAPSADWEQHSSTCDRHPRSASRERPSDGQHHQIGRASCRESV